KCNIETTEKMCPVCGAATVEDIPSEVFWCDSCSTPVLQEVTQADKGICPLCGNKMRYISTDLRPVFPEERLLLEIMLGKRPNEYISEPVWAINNRYYVNGKAIILPNSFFENADAQTISN